MGELKACPYCGCDLEELALSDQAASKCPECGAVLQTQAGPADHALLLVPPSRVQHGDLVDMTAMVDIVFFLLIFFLVTSMQSLESTIGLPTPQGTAAAASTAKVEDFAENPDYLTVTIYEDDAVWVENEETFGDQDLRAKLRAVRKANDRITGMLIVGAADADHGAFVGVLDAAADTGFEDVRFSILEDDQLSPTGGIAMSNGK